MTLRIGSHDPSRLRAPDVTESGNARITARVAGRVQGVGYRYFVQAEAARLELSGTVRNLPDGGVAVEAEGPRPALHELLGRLREGPPAARVTSVDVNWHSPLGQTEFRILPG